jgi:hypothetical protein
MDLRRFLIFIIGCIGFRAALVYAAAKLSMTHLKYMGYLALLPVIGFFYIYLTGARATGPEVGGEKIWWNDLRPIHGTMYALFAYNAINGNPDSYLYLLADVTFGLTAFLVHHFVL